MTAYGDSNKIYLSKEYLATVWAVPGLDAMIKVDTLEEYVHVGMDLDTAEGCQDDLHDPPNTIAHLRRAGAGGNYNVSVTELTEGTWEAV